MKLRIDMAGVRCGRLVGLAFVELRGGHAYWRFQCDCGRTTVADGAKARAGRTSSCGCLHRELSAARLTVHGRRACKRHDRTYRAWQEINVYCGHPGSPRYRDFGGAGVVVCEAWRDDFEAFLAHMGERPPGTMLIRLDPALDFAPGNCAWATVRSRSARAAAGARRRRAGEGRWTPSGPIGVIKEAQAAPAVEAGVSRSDRRRRASSSPAAVLESDVSRVR